jgi:hypothetical protein
VYKSTRAAKLSSKVGESSVLDDQRDVSICKVLEINQTYLWEHLQEKFKQNMKTLMMKDMQDNFKPLSTATRPLLYREGP